MVNSNVIRGGGLIVLAGCYLGVERVFTNNVVNDATETYISLIGAGRGSMYNTCTGESKTLQKLTSVNLADKAATDLKYNFYNIDNPKAYLGGSDAVVVEQGPYNLRKYSVAYDVAQTPSSLTASDPDPKGALEYSTANAYLILDQDVKATSNLKRNGDLSLAFSDSKVTHPETKRALASHLSMMDSVVNFSPDYLSLLGAMNDEVNMILSLACTSDQIANIGVAGKGQCGDISAINCACCMMDDEYTLATSRNTGVPPEFTNCNSYFDDEGPILSKLSLLASHDGGVAVKSAGEKKYDGSGNDFTATSFGQTEIHTALIQSHTINDLMFGYPSAYLGSVAFHAQMYQALSSTELAKSMLTGQKDADLSFKLGNIAEYTSKVGSVCFATCLEGGDCSGQAPGRYETSDVDKIKLGGIECKPYTSTFETVAKCTAINTALQVDLAAPGYEACVCANGSDEWSSQGCCLAGGKQNGSYLTGEGCLFEVAGVVDPNYAGMDTSIANAVDLGTALQSWIDVEVSSPSSEFMCPASGAGLDEHGNFGYYESYDGSKEHVTYYHTGNDRMRQDDVANSASTEYSTSVTGGSGKYFSPKGLTAKVGTSQISDGYPKKIPHPVYVPSAKKSIDFVFEGVREKFVRNKICGTDTCIVSARLRPNATSFHISENGNDGTGMPFDGLQTVGHVSGPSTTGRPEYFHQPLYFDGDETLYTQQDSSYAETADGNGIKIYRPTTASDPSAFNPSAPGSNYQLVDKAYVDSQNEVIQSHIDIEVGSGLGARQRMRFGTSYSIWECDPSTNEKCKVAVNSKGANDCYTTTGSTLFDAVVTADKNDLTTLGRSDFTYPCSAANLLTPHVVGGKILPMYWYEESTIHATADEIDVLAAYAASYNQSGINFILAFGLAFVAAFLGVSMLMLCLCFEQKHSFMSKTEGTKTETTTTKSSVA
mmetsp:Transcript_19577/g.35437  ORF Transcript_19577/g.35437 Transcript_19577/m.35437 type:complete len:941 (+) Transcript_19577:340-3162(+)